ncbi:MAG: serine/threonine protein kinase [Deltaproteobacteria bacterium]|nr:serine/threonine protein kinase [Deltaproteobacteria bacterium]
MKRDTPGTVLAGKYELIRIAGQGGMALVWRAKMRARGEERPVAVKRMLVNDRDHEFAELFEEEARVGLQLKHPNIVQVLDFAADEKHGYYLVMEWVEGIDLLDFMKAYHADKRHMPWQVVMAIGLGACRGLQGAHERTDLKGQRHPVIHRDLTPGNVLVGMDGEVKIADFGLARATDRGSMTMPNTIKGKLSYTAPEIANGERATERSDIFGLGVTLWECLAARKLFFGKSNLEVIQAIYQWNVTPLATLRPDVPLPVVEVVTRAIARNPANRFGSAREMGEALAAVLQSDPVDAARLGATVRAARARLEQIDGEAPDSTKEISLSEELSSRDLQPLPSSRRQAPPPPRPPRISSVPTPPVVATPAPAKPRAIPPPPPKIAPKPATIPSPKPATTPTPKPATIPSPKPATIPSPKPATIPSPKPDEKQPARKHVSTPLSRLQPLGPAPTKPAPAPAPTKPEPPPAPLSPVAKILSERPAPAIHEAAPHEALHLSFSDLFEAGIKADVDVDASPASSRMGRRKDPSDLTGVLDHLSSWDLPVEPPKSKARLPRKK